MILLPFLMLIEMVGRIFWEMEEPALILMWLLLARLSSAVSEGGCRLFSLEELLQTLDF